MKLWIKVPMGMLLGILAGIWFPSYTSYIKPLGDIFLRLIKMVVGPLIFFSLIAGITRMDDSTSFNRVGIKSLIIYLSTTLCAAMLGIVSALILAPGHGIHIHLTEQSSIPSFQAFNLKRFFIEIIPDNIATAFVHTNILQIVFLALFTGYILHKMGNNSNPIKELFYWLYQINLKMIESITQLTPYAAFALTAWIIRNQGLVVIVNLSKLLMTIGLAMLCQYMVFGILIYCFARISPLPFYKKSIEYQLLAISTSSSKASLGTTLKVCQEKLGISHHSASFVLPLGASINMDGSAIALGVITIFFAQLLGIDLALHDYLIITLTSTIGSIGAAGIPGGSLLMLPVVLSSVNMPLEGIAIIAGIDRIIDMLRTAINITGDVAVTLMIDSSEGTLDKEKYFS